MLNQHDTRHRELALKIAAVFDGLDVIIPSQDELPLNIDDAERIEDEIVSRLGEVGAYKLGATIAAVRATLGLPRQFFGPTPSNRVFEDGADIPANIARQRGVESEYAFRLARDLTEADARLDEAGLVAAIASVHAAIEVPGSRFSGLGAHGGFALVADAGAVGSLVVGGGQPLGDPARLNDAPVILEIEGQEPVQGGGAIIDGGPLGPLLAFVRGALARGYPLRAGHVIVTGSCTGYVEVPAGKRVTARFPAIGASASLRFAEAA